MNGVKEIVKKEIQRIFTDKKMIFSLFIMPAILIIFLFNLMGTMMNKMSSDIESHQSRVCFINPPDVERLSVDLGKEAIIETRKGEIHSEETTAFLEEKRNEIRTGNLDLIVVFDLNFIEQVKEYKLGNEIPEVKTYYNPSEDYSKEAREKFLVSLESYRQFLLEKRFSDLNSLTIFEVDRENATSQIIDEEKAGGKALAMMLPYLIVMLLFTGPMSLGIDAITGEKERGTLASMLVTPLKRSEIVMGKLISLALLSCLYALVYAGSMIVAMSTMYAGMLSDMETQMMTFIKFQPIQMIELLCIVITLVYLYVSIVALVAVWAKTSKEAGTYVSPIYFIVIIAGVFTMFGGNEQIKLGMFAIPVYGSAAAIQKILTNELALPQLLLTCGSTIIIAALLTVLITKAFNSEKVMFNA